MKQTNQSIALVHDFLLYPGGAERVLRVLADMYPTAPIYTLLYDEERMGGMFHDRQVVVSGLQKLPQFVRRRHRYLLPILPTMPETFDLRDFGLVISSSGAWSKGIVTRLDTMHVAYLHSPMRFVWDCNERYVRQARGGKKPGLLIKTLLSYLRLWDYQAAQRPDVLIANSLYTQERVRKYYGRESHILYPPAWHVPTKRTEESGDMQRITKPYFLIVSRLSRYKNVSLAVEVCNKLGLELVVIGQGEQYDELKQMAGPTVRILGWLPDEQRNEYYRNARAFLFPSEDDFGMTVVEAMGYGLPVVAYARGGACEIVEPGISGELFTEATPEVFADAIRRYVHNEESYNRKVIRQRATRFSRTQFETGLRYILETEQMK